MQVQDENAGKQCKCPKCGAVCQIPEAPVAAAPEAAPAAAPAAPAAAPAATAPVAGKRPGGLTALAVLNFVFGGFQIIGGLMGLACSQAVSTTQSWSDQLGEAARQGAQSTGNREAIRRANEAFGEAAQSASSFTLMFGIFGLIVGALLIVAGIGYLKQSKKSGWMFGNIYGIAAIIVVILQIAMIGIPLWFLFILGLAYPIVTLALLNTSFKNSFPNP